jgi:uncharacterized protein YbjT (DUF2867 family)
MSDSFVVVCGATGKQGGAVVETLLRRGRFKVRALVRDPRKAAELVNRGVELVTGDLVNTESLVRAFSGAAGAFGVTQPWSPDYRKADVENEVIQGRSLVEAASRAQINLVLSTVLLVDHKPTGIPHVDSKIEIEKAAQRLGGRVIILGPGSFLDNIGQPWYPVRKGKVRGFVDADVKVPLVACRDIGEAAGELLENFAGHAGRRINLVDGLYSGLDICAALSRLRGGEPFKWSAPPKLLMRLFAKEFYKMRIAFEENGRPPTHPALTDAVRETDELVPAHLTLDSYLKMKGYDTRPLD